MRAVPKSMRSSLPRGAKKYEKQKPFFKRKIQTLLNMCFAFDNRLIADSGTLTFSPPLCFLPVSSNAAAIPQKILPKNFVSKSGTAMFGSTLSVNPRCAASAEAAQTRNAAFTVCPLSSISLSTARAGTALTHPISRGSKAAIPHSELFPDTVERRDNARRSNSAVGGYRASRFRLRETVFIASSSGVSLAISRYPFRIETHRESAPLLRRLAAVSKTG